MGLVKTALIVGGVVLGLGTVGGITAAVVTRQSGEESSLVIPNKEAESDIQADESSASHSNEPAISQITAESILKQINEEDIVVKKGQKETKPAENYAFDLDKKSLAIKSDKNKILEGYETTLTIQNSNNSLEKLNNGELVVNVHLKNQKTNDEANRNLKITTFKKADQSLIDLLDKNEVDSKLNQDYSLTLLLKDSAANKFTSLEDLNEKQKDKTPNGLTTLFKNSNKSQEDNDEISLVGLVKVSKLSKNKTNTTIFELTSAIEGEYIKLLKTQKSNNEVTKAAFKVIKTTNLLPTEVSVFPLSHNETKTASFNETLLKKASSTDQKDGFLAINNRVNISIKKEGGSESDLSDVQLNAYSVLNEKQTLKLELKLGVKVSFGERETKTSFASNVNEQNKQLVDSGMSFHFYTRLLEDKDELTAQNIKASDLKIGHHKLGAYFVTEKYLNPSKKPDVNTLRGETNAAANNNFHVLGPFSTNIGEGVKFEVNKPDENKSKYYLVFADYSYTSNPSNDSFALKEKVLYSPYLSLIQVKNMDKASQ